MLNDIINMAFRDNGYDIETKVIKSNRPELCDYQCDDVFKIAKLFHKNPILVGEELVKYLNNIDNFDDYFDKIEFVAPGFINMSISNKLINETLIKMMETEKFNIELPSRTETYILDYGGPNVAKPLHVGHMRTAIVGESIKRIINYFGHRTISDVHLGDYGLQIGQVIYGIKKENKKIDDITLEYLEEIYPKMSALCKEDEKVKEECSNITKQLQDGDEEYRKLWEVILKVSCADIKRLYDFLDVHFDLWQGESDAYPYLESVEKLFEEKDLIETSDGARIIQVDNDDDVKQIPPLIFKNSMGAYLYASTDLATIYERVKKYNPDHILYVVDNRQSLHFEQVFRVCDKSNLIDKNKLEFLGYGTINGMDGKPYKTRSGDAPKLDGLFSQIKEIFISLKEDNKEMSNEDIDKIVNSILKFADLQNNRQRDYIFDIKKFSDIVGKTGPYILYTYLRINKILEGENIYNKLSNNIYNEIDRNLRLKILDLESYLKSAFQERMPSYIADYIYSLALLSNNFYQNNHINGLDDLEKKNDWLFILKLVNNILREMLNLIVIDIPSHM
jgi:arginyl-tRNA synthetase